jgi:hypothetical protein
MKLIVKIKYRNITKKRKKKIDLEKQIKKLIYYNKNKKITSNFLLHYNLTSIKKS